MQGGVTPGPGRVRGDGDLAGDVREALAPPGDLQRYGNVREPPVAQGPEVGVEEVGVRRGGALDGVTAPEDGTGVGRPARQDLGLARC